VIGSMTRPQCVADDPGPHILEDLRAAKGRSGHLRTQVYGTDNWEISCDSYISRDWAVCAVCERSRSAGSGGAGQPVFAGGRTVGRDGRLHLPRRRGGDPDVPRRYTGVEGVEGGDQGVAGSRDPGLPLFTAGGARPVDITPASTVHLPGRASTYMRCPHADRVKGFEHRPLLRLANANETHASTRETLSFRQRPWR